MMNRRGARRSTDWKDRRERLARAQADAAGAGAELSPERARAVMDERARLLARRAPDVQPSGTVLEVLTFALGRERYAIETTYIREVVRLADLTPVPAAPDFVAGVTNYRGQVLCVVDLRVVLAAPAGKLSDLSMLIVLGIDAVEFGVLADQAEEIRRIDLGGVAAASAAGPGARPEHLLGVTPQGLTIVDGASLLRTPRLFVNQADTPSA
jgi:purine-binding chemotaxis protein CheW